MNTKSLGRKILSVVSTMLYVVLIAILLFALILNLNKKDNQVSGFLGISFAVVQSPSMKAAGFDVGDMVIIKSTPTNNLKKNDIIVFYQYADPADSTVMSYVLAHKITDQIEDGTYEESRQDASSLGRRTINDAAAATNKLIFHRIVDIYVDQYGTRFFQTKGDSNATADSVYVREDFVTAIYVATSPFVQGVLKFVTSPVGLCVVIILPILLTVGLQVFSFILDAKSTRVATKLLTRKIRCKDVDFAKIKLADYLSEPEKAYLYDISPEEDKLDLAIILWDESMQDVLNDYKKDRNKFYEYFFERFKKGDDKKLEFLKIKADLLHKNPKLAEEDLDSHAKVIYNSQKENPNATNASHNDGKR